MSAIKVSNFEVVMNNYIEAREKMKAVSSYLYNAAREIARLTDFEPQLDLLRPFYSAYKSVDSMFSQSSTTSIQAIRALVEHILSQAKDNSGSSFANFDDWIDANGVNGSGVNVGRQGDDDTSLSITDEAADLFAEAGYTVSAENKTGASGTTRIGVGIS